MRIFPIFILSVLLLFASCNRDSAFEPSIPKQKIEKTVAVVLPMEHGLEKHWHRCLDLYTAGLSRAYKSQDKEIILNFEFYDELSEDLDEIGASLGRRDDIFAVIGGLYSADAAILTRQLSRVGKTLFTLATSEELVRAYASTGYLWAMTETDITQCEVLLSRAFNYGGESVALIAKDNDIYGKTFLDWFAFQAVELGMKNNGVYPYTEATILNQMETALHSDAQYLICAPSETREILQMLQVYNAIQNDPTNASQLPRLLFSDTAYGTDVLNLVGHEAEGLEGVAFGADPESGFDIAYRTYYGENPTTGEAQLYDAAMLLGYGAWYQTMHPECSLQTALRSVVSGTDINMGSWTGEDMSLVIDAIARGDAPAVSGASGKLKFDRKIFTNVLCTTYYNYRVYEGRYVILDYNTSDGGNRTDATLAGWNWKISQMQEFDDASSLTYPTLQDKWALLVATSDGWDNYRHQADVLAIYSQLRRNGYPDDHIILIEEDDIAFNPSNPEQGVVRIVSGGENVYENAQIDYRLSDLKPEDFLSILEGRKTGRTPDVINAGANDNIFVFWSGHGLPGQLCWHNQKESIDANMLSETLNRMHQEKKYRKLLMMVESCYSGGVLQQCEGTPGMLFVTSANADETSKADVFNSHLNVWMSNRFTSTFIEAIRENSGVSLRDLYYRLFINTVGSHVMVYNSAAYGNLYSSDMSEFINYSD